MALRNTDAFIELNHGGIHSLQIQPRSFGGCDSQAHRYSSIDVNQARRPSSETSGYGVHSPFSSLVFHTLPCFFHFFVCVVISHETKSSTFWWVWLGGLVFQNQSVLQLSCNARPWTLDDCLVLHRRTRACVVSMDVMQWPNYILTWIPASSEVSLCALSLWWSHRFLVQTLPIRFREWLLLWLWCFG